MPALLTMMVHVLCAEIPQAPTSPAGKDEEPADASTMLVDFLRHRDVACPRCGYNLRNLTQPVCPECMESLSLKVGVTKLAIAPLLVTLAPGGFCLVAVGIFLVMCVLHGPPPLRESGVWLTMAFLAVSGLAAIVLACSNRWFMKLGTAAQTTLAAVTWGVHLIVFVILVSSVT